MTIAASGSRRSGGYLERPAPSSLADVIDSILDKGLVIDAYVRVSLVGIELLTIDARIVIASVDTYLRFAEATNRLDLAEKSKDLPEVIEEMSEGGAEGKSRGILSGAKEALLGSSNDDKGGDEEEGEDEDQYEEARPRRRPAKKATRRRRTEE
ncbi:gas vesicle protein GvpJ [Kribbella sp. NPDC059898]|uniref:gas vesicle protein GvpJ n=1 Tax=Kribbella sp. NPDC059898 TaxID=3346995 RepID=UPI0036651827